jgi:CheY-like chemotaxis protein
MDADVWMTVDKLDGYEVCRMLRRLAASAETTIDALAGWGSPDDRRRGDATGFDTHRTAPSGWPRNEALPQAA